MKKLALLIPLAVAGCTTEQINAAANAACSALSIEANAYANSTDPGIKAAVVAIQTVCADPMATVTQVNAARVYLKNAINSHG
jgi:hypothetical protein